MVGIRSSRSLGFANGCQPGENDSGGPSRVGRRYSIPLAVRRARASPCVVAACDRVKRQDAKTGQTEDTAMCASCLLDLNCVVNA